MTAAPASQAEQPCNALPLLPPAAAVETRAILKACIRARAARAELKASAGLIPNQTMLISTIPILETRASSEIEGIVTTTDRLFQFAQSERQADPVTHAASRHLAALVELGILRSQSAGRDRSRTA